MSSTCKLSPSHQAYLWNHEEVHEEVSKRVYNSAQILGFQPAHMMIPPVKPSLYVDVP